MWCVGHQGASVKFGQNVCALRYKQADTADPCLDPEEIFQNICPDNNALLLCDSRRRAP